MNVIHRKDAKKIGLKFCFTGRPCKHGHITKRYVKNNACLGCDKQRRIDNKDKRNEQSRKWRAKNTARVRDYNQKWIADNSEYISEYNKRRYQENPEFHRERSRLFNIENPDNAKNYRINNLDKMNAKAAKQRATKLQRTPVWADLIEIQNFYTKSHQLSKDTGNLHHVDHIIPLQGKFVSGLHVSENLQVIRADENLKKNNRYVPT